MFEIHGNEVLQVQEMQTKTQTAIVKTFYDMLYHTKLEINNKVKASVYNYLNELQTDYVGNVIFDVDGTITEIPVSNGIAEIDVTAPCTIKTVNEGFRNSEITIE